MRRIGHGEPLGIAWRISWASLYVPVGAAVKLEYRNIEAMPQTGPVIVVVNHISHIDPFLISRFVLDAGRVPRFLAKSSIFDVPVVGPAMRGMGHVPVQRGTVDAQRSLNAAVDALGKGRVIVLHPEGTVTRDPDGWPMNARSGAARLSMLAPEVPVIPVAQWGIQNSIDLYRKKVRLWPRPRHVISVGQPVDLKEFADVKPTAENLRRMTEVIMTELRKDVAELRGLPAPTGPFYRWSRSRGGS
jgi:1-acyl-sn-glycerol-3-phosphate acyltransferase